MVEHSLSMREVPGSIPGFSSDMLHQHLILFKVVLYSKNPISCELSLKETFSSIVKIIMS